MRATDLDEARREIQDVLTPPSAFEVTWGARHAAWDQRRRELRAQPRSSTSSPQSIANEAYLATLSICLWANQVSGKSDFELFDRLLKSGVRECSKPSTSTDPQSLPFRQVTKPATAVEREILVSALQRLAVESSSHSMRLQSIRKIAEIADRFSDLNYQDAHVLAEAMLKAYESDTLEIEKAWYAMRHWPNLILAVLDLHEPLKMTTDQVLGAFGVLLRGNLALSGRFPWQDDVRRMVLTRLIQGLSESIQTSSDSNARPWSQLEGYFAELQRTRASALNLA